jgi:hypothetical protein
MNTDFGTSDIVLAATLKVLGYALIQIEKNGNKGTFYFKEVPEKVINEFDTGQCQVEPVSFNNAIKMLTTSVRRQY